MSAGSLPVTGTPDGRSREIAAAALNASTSQSGAVSGYVASVLRLDDDRFRLGVRHDVPKLALTIENVDRHHDDAEPRAREKQVDEFDAVREMNAQPVAARQPARRELVRHPIRARVDVAEGERAERAVDIGVLDPDAIGAAAKRLVEELRERHVSSSVSRAVARLDRTEVEIERQLEAERAHYGLNDRDRSRRGRISEERSGNLAARRASSPAGRRIRNFTRFADTRDVSHGGRSVSVSLWVDTKSGVAFRARPIYTNCRRSNYSFMTDAVSVLGSTFSSSRLTTAQS